MESDDQIEILYELVGDLECHFSHSAYSTESMGYLVHKDCKEADANYTFTVTLFEGRMNFIMSFESYGRSHCHNGLRTHLSNIDNSSISIKHSKSLPRNWKCEIPLGDPDLKEKARDTCEKVINAINRSRIK